MTPTIWQMLDGVRFALLSLMLITVSLIAILIIIASLIQMARWIHF